MVAFFVLNIHKHERRFNLYYPSLNMPTPRQPIAITGIACRFPGANNYQQYWKNLIAGKDSVSEIPKERWDWREYYGDPQKPNKTNSKWGGFIEDIDKFDAGFFGISPKEAELMDPQQRLMLELSWACLEDAGYTPESLSGSNTGVFIGVANYDYKELLEKHLPAAEAHQGTGSYISIIPNRISYFLNLHGPSMAIAPPAPAPCLLWIMGVRRFSKGKAT